MQRELLITAEVPETHYWQNIWSYRELLYFLSWRDFLARYKQTTIGILWVILRPFGIMVVFSIIFGKLAKLPSEGIPYPIMIFSGLLPWQFVSKALSESANSIITNANLISKVYFPRLIIPISSVNVSFVDFLASGIILAGLMIGYGFYPGARILFLPIFIFMSFITALGMGLWLSAFNAAYRDLRHIVPVIVQFGLYISPVGFTSSVIPVKWQLLFYFNPMAGIIDGFRWAIFTNYDTFWIPGFFISLVISILIFSSGLWVFKIKEKTFADVI